MRMTKHGKQRIHERAGGGKAKAERRVALALERGYEYEQTKGSLRRYLDGLIRYNGTADRLIVHGDKVYIFCGEALVTVYDLPRKYVQNLKKYVKGE